jgi:hypothetical protein
MSQEFDRILQAAKSGDLTGKAADDLLALQQQVATEALFLERGMTNAARALREQAGLGAALTAEQAKGITAWAAAEATARLQLDALQKALQELHAGMTLGRVGGDALDLVAPEPAEPALAP